MLRMEWGEEKFFDQNDEKKSNVRLPFWKEARRKVKRDPEVDPEVSRAPSGTTSTQPEPQLIENENKKMFHVSVATQKERKLPIDAAIQFYATIKKSFSAVI